MISLSGKRANNINNNNSYIVIFSSCGWTEFTADLFMSQKTPPQRHQKPLPITLYRNPLVSSSDTLNIESSEFPFHTLRGQQRGEQSWRIHKGAAEESERSNKQFGL